MPNLSALLGNSFAGFQGSQGVQSTQGVQGSILTNVPQNSKTTSYTLLASDVGKHVSTNAGVIVPISTFFPGDTITIYNNSSADITISKQSGQEANITMYLAGTATNTTNRTLAQRGLCTLLCIVGGSIPTFVIAGSGLS
jgi:hypothetical protein